MVICQFSTQKLGTFDVRRISDRIFNVYQLHNHQTTGKIVIYERCLSLHGGILQRLESESELVKKSLSSKHLIVIFVYRVKAGIINGRGNRFKNESM